MSESAKPKNEAPLERSVPGAPLESILCTEELHRRPSRPPDYEKENSALVALVGALADSPRTILQTLAETILEVTQSDSAGLSLLTKDEKRFYWPAIAGMWSPHIGGGTPREFGPCGDVLDRNCTLLFKHFEQRYPYFQPVTPLIEECLLVPFYVDGRAVGTIWAITHSDRHKFDAEDDRVMASLGKFASSAYQAVQSIDDLRFQVAEREKAEKELRELTDGLETQVRARTEELEHRNTQLSEARARLAVEKLAVERSEAYLAEAQRLSHTGSWHWNVTSGEVFWSKEFFSIFGLDSKEDEASYQSYVGRIHPEDRANVEKARLAAITEKRDFETEYRLLLPEGSIKYLHSLGKCSVSGSGDVEYIGAVVDITERKLDEQKLRDSEEKHRVVVEAASDAVISMDENGTVPLANAATMRIFGYDPVELIGKPLTVLMPEFLRKLHEAGFANYLSTGKRHINWQGTELTGLRKGGQEFPVEISFGELMKDGQRIFTGFIRDISERKRAEEALRSSEAFLAEAQRLSHTGSWRWDVGAGKVVGSQECFAIFGVDSDMNEGSYAWFMDCVHPEDRSKVEKTVWAAVKEKRDWELECRLLLPGGVIKYIHDIGHCRASESGGVEYIGTAMDVTERKRAEEERERLHQVLADLAHINRVSTMGELTASLAHEIKQPIAAAVTDAKTCMRWLAREQPDTTEAQQAASRLVNDVSRASDIINRIGSLFKKGTLQREMVDVNELIGEMIVLLRAEAHRFSISIHSNLANDLPQIMADRVQLQQVFMNLMLNGIDAIKDRHCSGKLTITTLQNENDQLLVSIADTGVGLRPEQTEHIFDAFFTSKAGGTGMGLPISRSIIESHGGRLWATPNAVPGATFRFTLPIEKIAHQVALESTAPEAAGHSDPSR